MSASSVALTALAVTIFSVVLGQGVWRLAGVRGWSWAAPATGLAALLVLCSVAVELPGAGTTGAAAVALAFLVSAVLVRRDASRSVTAELAVVLVLALLVAAVPFIAAGRVGTLGVTDNGDLGGHILLADSVRTGDGPVGLDPGWHRNYPTGSHSLVASFATLLGNVEIDAAFMGLQLALIALGALTALAALRSLPPPARVVGALLVGAPYLVAAYAVQASYKETLIGVLALGFGLALPAIRTARAALPLVVIAAGAFAAYSFVGLEWPALIAALWFGLRALGERRLPDGAALRRAVKPALGLAALLALAIAPQAGRARDLVDAVINTAQGESTGGNVRGELASYEVFGVWWTTDPRTLGEHPTLTRALAALGALAFAYGVWWCWRRRRYELLGLAGGCLFVYVQARVLATPYYSGKALSIAAAPVMLVAVHAALASLARERPASGGRSAAAAAAAAATFLLLAAWSSGLVLRGAAVEPPAHPNELKSFRSLVAGQPTFFFGRNDYIHYMLRGAKVAAPYTYLGQSQLGFQTRPAKAWEVPHSFDWDALDAANLDRFRFVVAPRSAYLSDPPPNWKRVRATRSYLVWERLGATPPRETLAEPDAPGSVLDCDTPEGAAVAAIAGEGAVRTRPLEVRPRELDFQPRDLVDLKPSRFAVLEMGNSARARLDVPRGSWDVSLQYVSPEPVSVVAGGRRLQGPASLEGTGGFWHIGAFAAPGGAVDLRIEIGDGPPFFSSRSALVGRLVLTRAGERPRMVPLAQACGEYVDWYRPN